MRNNISETTPRRYFISLNFDAITDLNKEGCVLVGSGDDGLDEYYVRIGAEYDWLEKLILYKMYECKLQSFENGRNMGELETLMKVEQASFWTRLMYLFDFGRCSFLFKKNTH